STEPRATAPPALDMCQACEVDSVELVYTRFVSAGFQEVVLRALVPLEHELLAAGDAKEDRDNAGASAAPAVRATRPCPSYDFDPAPAPILEALLPRYVEARIYAALLNAA